MFRFFSIAVLCLASVAFFPGCSNKVGVHGKVTYTDGENVGRGSVNFISDSKTYAGVIDKKTSEYSLGAGGDGSGVLKGTYSVILSSSDLEHIYIPLKYNKKETSGLTCEVNGATTFDIVVERPTAAEQPKKRQLDH